MKEVSLYSSGVAVQSPPHFLRSSSERLVCTEAAREGFLWLRAYREGNLGFLVYARILSVAAPEREEPLPCPQLDLFKNIIKSYSTDGTSRVFYLHHKLSHYFSHDQCCHVLLLSQLGKRNTFQLLKITSTHSIYWVADFTIFRRRSKGDMACGYWHEGVGTVMYSISIYSCPWISWFNRPRLHWCFF